MIGDMPCGNCCVCRDPVDHSEAGFCEVCGNAFHWNECGGWEDGKHTCENCSVEGVQP
jgi:hypothetical protein